MLGGLFNGVDTPNSKGPKLIDTGSGAVNRRSFVSRNGHRIDLLDESGKTEGITAETGDGKLRISLDSVGTRVVVHSDGTVLIEGKNGIIVDATTSNLDLKGKEDHDHRNQWRHGERRQRRGRRRQPKQACR